MNIQDIIAQAQAAASPTIQPAVPADNTSVPVPNLPTPQQAYAIQASQSTGQGAESADALEHDLRNLNALQLMQKYGYEVGQQMATQRAVATQQVANDLTTPRTTSQLAGDVVSDIGAGAVNMLGGTAAMAAGLFSRDAGTAMAGTMNDFNEFVRNNQSPAQRAAQRNVQARDAMGQRDSKQQMDREIAEGSGETVAGIRRVLRDIGNSLINTAGNSTALGSLVAQGIGSALPVMGISGAAGALSRNALNTAVKSGALTQAEATALMTKAGSWGTAATIGSMEAGGAYQQAVSQVMDMEDAQLVKGSPEFRTLLEQGVVPSEAKKIIANKAGLAAAGMTAPFAIALGRTVAKFEGNPLAAVSLSGAARNTGMQTLEEAAQGGGSQFMGNTAIQAIANENQDWTEGVGGQIGTGALAGAGKAGVMQAPGVLGNAVSPAVQATARGAANLAKSLSPEIPSEVLPPAVQPTLSMPTAVKQAGEVLQQAPAVTERMVQEIQASNATLAEKTQQLSLVQQLNQGISYSPDEFDASPMASVVPELKESLAGSTNLLEAIQATGNTLLGGKLEPQKAVAAVTYLDQLLGQAEAYAGSAVGDALITQAQAATTDTDAQAFLSAMGQVFQNMETSTELNQYREQARKTFEKQAAPTEVNADTSPEIVSRATHAPHTLQHATVQDLLAQHDAGTIQLSDAQVMRLRGAAALTQAMDSLGANTEQGSTNPIVVVTRQVAFNPEKEDEQKYPSVAQHHQDIVNALAKNDLERAKKGMADLGNLARTFNNKVAALNQHIAAGPSSEHVKYENWVPNHGLRESAKGMYYLPRSSQSRVFASQVAAETMLAVGAYNNLAEQFNTLEVAPIPLVQLDQRAKTAPTAAPVAPKKGQSLKPGQKAISELSEAEIMKRIQHIERNNVASSLANNTVYQALRNELKARAAAIEAANKQRQRESKKINDPNNSAKAKVAPNANSNTEGGVVTGPKDAPKDTEPNKLPWEASAAPETNSVSLEETFKGLMNEVEALQKMMFDEDLNASPTAYKLMADLEDAMTSLVEHTRTSYAQGLLEYIKYYIAHVAEEGKGRSWDADDFHGLVLRAQYHLKEFTAQTDELTEAPTAPSTSSTSTPPAGKAPPPSAPNNPAAAASVAAPNAVGEKAQTSIRRGPQSPTNQTPEESAKYDRWLQIIDSIEDGAVYTDPVSGDTYTARVTEPGVDKRGKQRGKSVSLVDGDGVPAYSLASNGEAGKDAGYFGASIEGLNGPAWTLETQVVAPDAAKGGRTSESDVERAGGFVMPEGEVFAYGDEGQSPWLMADGKVVGTGQDHISFAEAMLMNEGVVVQKSTYDQFMRAKNAVRASFFKDAVEGYVAMLHTHVGQKLTGEQVAFLKRLSDANDGKLTIMHGQADGLVNPEYTQVSLSDLSAVEAQQSSNQGEWKKSNTSQGTDADSAITPSKENPELNMVNSLAAALGLPAIKEIGDNPESRGADYSPVDNRMRVDPRLKGNSRISVILHEMGHHTTVNVLAERLGVSASEILSYSDEQLLQAFRDNFPEVAREYDQWLQERRDVLTRGSVSNAPRTPISRSAMAKSVFDFLFKGKGVSKIFGPKKRGKERTRNSGFHEWLADNIGKALEENQTTQGIVGQFFKRVANAFRKLYAAVKSDPDLKNFAPAASVQEWLQKVLDRSINAAPGQELASEEVFQDGNPDAPLQVTQAELDEASEWEKRINDNPDLMDSAPARVLEIIQAKSSDGVGIEVVTEEAPTTDQVEKTSPIKRAARLLKSNDGKENLFVRLFKLRGKPTRLTTLGGDAYDVVMDALSSPAKFQAFTGSKNAPPADQLAKAAAYFSTYGAFLISNARELISGTDPKNPGLLNTKVPVKGVNMTRLQVLQAIQAGEKLPQGITHPDTWKEGLGAINTFVDPENGSLDEYFLTAAGIAAAQWLLTSGGKGVAKYSEKTVAGMVGIPVDMVTDNLRAQVSAGLSHLDLVRGIADQIERYLGVEVKNDVPLFRAQSLSTSLAVLMLESMLSDAAAGSFMDIVTLHVGNSGQIIGKEIKTFEGVKTFIKLPSKMSSTDYRTIVRYVPVKPVQVTAEFGFSSVMDQLLKAEPENALYFDKDQLEVSHTQLRSSVPLTKADKASQAKLQETPHKLNPHFAKLIKLLPVDALQKLLGGEVSEDMNKNHAASVDGKRVTVSGSRNQVDFVLGEITTQALLQGKESHEVEVFYKYEVASQGRSMMQGKYNPQSDKVMRNLIMPMVATLDLNDTEHRLAWDMASLQMLGERTYAMQPEAITARAQEVFGQPEVKEAIAVMQRVLQDEAVLADEIVEAMQKAAPFLGDGATPEAMHVLLDRARFQMSDDVSAFESRLYLEADGVANGPAGAMAMMFSGGDLVEYVRKMRKAGFFIGEPEMVMANHRQRDSVDLYATSGELTAKAAAERLGKYGDSKNQQNMKNAHLAVIELMSALFPAGSITFKDGELTIKRSVTKNPLTVTVYGSGARGIAGKLLGIIESELYERMTNAMRTGVLDTSHLTPEEFKQFLQYLTTFGATRVEAVNQDTGITFKYWTMENQNNPRSNFLGSNTFAEFTLNAGERKTLQDNIHHFFVKDMVKGIEDTVGHSVMVNTKAMIAATTIQNHMVQHAFNTELEKLYDQKRAENSEWDPVIDGLSKKDFKALEKSLTHLNIALRTEKQEWEIGSSEQASVENVIVTKSPFNTNRFKVPAIMRQPGGAGVQVVPFLVIGMGDAAMVQNLQNDPNAPAHLQVFDGINLGLNDIKNGGAVVNKAMADAWLNANPLKAVADTFRKALALGDWDTVIMGLGPKEQERITQSLDKVGVTSVEHLQVRLDTQARNIDRIHQAIQEVGFASDQMAATGVAHAVEGTVNSDNEQDVADALKISLANQRMESGADVLAENKQGNLTVLAGDQIQRLVKSSMIRDSDLRAVAQRALNTNLGTTLEGMKVVIGSAGDLILGGYVGDTAVMDGLLAGTTKGFWDPQNRTLVLLEGFDQETLVHELVHAATLEVLHAFDQGLLPSTRWGNTVTDSINALDALLKDLVENGWDVSRYSEKAQRSYQDMMATIRRELGSLEAGLEGVPGSNRMNALNEMMAWVLTNQQVKEMSKLQKFKQLLQTAIGLLKSVLFGDAKAPTLKADVFSQISFHTQALMHANGELERRKVYEAALAQDTLQHSVSYGNDSRLADIGKSFHQRIGQYLAARGSLADQVGKKVDVKSASVIAAGVRVAVQSLGMVSKPQEAAAFTKIVQAMATQAQIDPLVLNEAQSLYKQAVRGLKVEHFLENENDQDPANLQAAENKLNFILGRGSVFTDSAGRSSLLPVFIGLGLTDPTVRMALAKVNTESGKQRIAGSIDDKLTTAANNVMRALQDKLVNGPRNPKNVNDALDSLAQTLIDDSVANANLIERMGGAVGNVVDSANQLVVNALAQSSKKVSAKASSIAAGTKNRALKAAAQTVSLTANIFNEEGAAANAETMIRSINKTKMPELIRSVVKDLTGRTKSNAGVYDMIKVASSKVSKVRQFYKEQLPSTLKNTFKKEPSTEQWTAMFKVAKVDWASLVPGVSQANAFAVFDKAERTKQIAALEQAIKVDPEAKRILQKAKQLANYMATGEAGPALLANADAVAHIIHDRVGNFRARKVEKSKTFVAEVDRLITLYALDQTPQDTLDAVVELNKQEPEAMKQILGVLKAQRETDQARRQGAARFNAVKGYIPSIGSEGASLVVENDKNMAEMKRKGYIRVANYTGSTIFQGSSMGYYFSPVSGKAPYNQGIFQNARLTSGGVDVGTGFAVGFPTAGRITQKTTVERLAKNMHADTSKEALRPIFAEDGSIIAFERSIDPVQMGRLNPSTHLALMLGQWMGRQAEEELAHGVNLDAMARVYAMWNNESATRKDEYINVLDPKQITDPVMRDALSLMPKQVRDEAERLFGKNTFMVRRDVFEDLFGYRDASFSDFWTGNSRWSPKTQETVRKLLERVFGPNALATVVTYEQRAKNVVKDVKTLIVVKSVVVPAVNLVANIFQMMANGVPLSVIIRGMRNKTLEVDAYMKSNLRKMDLQVELLAAKGNVTRTNKLTAQIQSIEDSHRRLSIWPLIEAGELGSISDVGISRDELLLSEGKLQEYLEAKTEKLPQGLKTAGKNILLTKDTALFQGMQKAMEYGDFLAKAIVYEHQLSKGMSKADALGMITDEFVNYDRLSGRVRGTLENFGLAWFWNYKLRIAKTAFRMIRQDPVRLALLAMLPMPIETPVSENVFTKLVEGNLGYSLGPGMAFDSIGMNPWINAMN